MNVFHTSNSNQFSNSVCIKYNRMSILGDKYILKKNYISSKKGTCQMDVVVDALDYSVVVNKVKFMSRDSNLCLF